jgi:hypothetical protein
MLFSLFLWHAIMGMRRRALWPYFRGLAGDTHGMQSSIAFYNLRKSAKSAESADCLSIENRKSTI